MQTEQWLDMLARQSGPAPRAVVARRLWPAVLVGLVAASTLALSVIGPLPAASFMEPTTWFKLSYALALAMAAGLLTARLARPIARLTLLRWLWVGVVGLALLVGVVALSLTPSDDWPVALLGGTWLECPWRVLAFSLPALAGILWAVKGLAPTRLQQAGWASGLLAGSLGAIGYALACPENSPTFVAVWYTLGVMLTACIGRWLGPRVLRW